MAYITAGSARAAPTYEPNAAGLGLAPQQMTCEGQVLTIVAPSTPGETQSWSVGQIVQGGTGHLIPTSFTFSATLAQYSDGSGDTVTLFGGSTSEGGGHANARQQSITCTASDVMPETLAPAVNDPMSGIDGSQIPPDVLANYGNYYPAFNTQVTAIPLP